MATQKKAKIEEQSANQDGVSTITTPLDMNQQISQTNENDPYRATAYTRYIGMLFNPAKSKIFYGILKTVTEQRALLAYASEIGESFRPATHVYFVRFLYALSIGYVVADVSQKAIEDHNSNLPNDKVAYRAVDNLLWHTFASMLLPTFTVHTIVSASGSALNKVYALEKWGNNAAVVRKWLPVTLGLATIFGTSVPHRIDDLVTAAMNASTRKWMANYLGDKQEQHHKKE